MTIDQFVQWSIVWASCDVPLATSLVILTLTAVSLAVDRCVKRVAGKYLISDTARVALWWISFAAISAIAYRI